jgi:hypothetical protein
MRRIVQLCPCGGQIVLASPCVPPSGLTCSKCDAIFEAASTLVLVKRGRDDSVIEGSLAKNTTQVVHTDEQRPAAESPTIR